MINRSLSIDRYLVTILASSLLIAFYNLSFFRHVLEVFPSSWGNIAFLVSIVITLVIITNLLLTLVCFRYTTKLILILIFLVSSVAAYFMDSYNVIINDEMIQNIIETNLAEVRDLLNLKLALYILILGIVPALIFTSITINKQTLSAIFLSKAKIIIVSIILILLQLFLFGDFYASFIREHKPLRFYINPDYYIFSSGKYLHTALINDNQKNKKVSIIGQDAIIPVSDTERELIILVVGETARADRFSLNDYGRITNPLLQKEKVISFRNFSACGTSTAVSVPCMFSILTRNQYDSNKASKTWNALDVLKHAGISILWRDNNSSSKGVANRIDYQDFRKENINPVCDIECRDVGMLYGLQDYIDAHNSGDILIVLHQMGNHGPDYYKRYPASFEKFRPVCRTNELEKCSAEEIGNAYDNAILYTDYFLSRVINLLKNNTPKFETTMLYISDHGESLGEGHLYLHGLPYLFAPDNQKKVAAIIWSDTNNDDVDMEMLRKKRDIEYSHDNLFHTLLGIMEITTSIYNPELNILNSHD